MQIYFDVPIPEGATHFLARTSPYRAYGRLDVVVMFFRFDTDKDRWECLTGDEQAEIWWPVATLFKNLDTSRILKLEQPGVST